MKKEAFFITIFIVFFLIGCAPSRDQELLDKLEQQSQQIQQLQEQLNELQEPDQEPIPTEPQKSYKVDLKTWTQDETIQGLALKNPKFTDALWFQYNYVDKYYYDLEGPIFPTDPFYKIVYSKRNRELNVNGLRIFDVDPHLEENDEEYISYAQNINQEDLTDTSISCSENTDCRNMNVFICTSETQIWYSWYAYPYVFEARNDNAETLNTFKDWYCEEKSA